MIILKTKNTKIPYCTFLGKPIDSPHKGPQWYGNGFHILTPSWISVWSFNPISTVTSTADHLRTILSTNPSSVQPLRQSSVNSRYENLIASCTDIIYIKNMIYLLSSISFPPTLHRNENVIWLHFFHWRHRKLTKSRAANTRFRVKWQLALQPCSEKIFVKMTFPFSCVRNKLNGS